MSSPYTPFQKKPNGAPKSGPPKLKKKPPTDLGDPDGDDDMDSAMASSHAAGVPPPDTGGGGDMSGSGGGVVLSLDQMGYHEEPHACALCKHYGQDGSCEVAQQPVDPEGGCSVFAGQDESGGEDQMGAPAPMAGGMPAGQMGGSGGYPS